MPDDCTAAMRAAATKAELLRILRDVRMFVDGAKTLDSVERGFSMFADKPPYCGVRHKMLTHDGSSWSIQYSASHYCSGTQDEPLSFEVWQCPKHPLLGQYGDGSDPYAFVPIETLCRVLTNHGGLLPLETHLVVHRLEGGGTAP